MAVVRIQKSYDKALEQGYVFHNMFLQDKAEFVAASPMFADPFAADFLADLQAADALPIYENELAEQSYLTQVVYEQMEKCRKQYRRLMLYVRMGWPSSEEVSESFGKSSFSKARSSAVLLVDLMYFAHATAEKPEYKQTLIDVGFSQAEIDLLHSLGDELNAANMAKNEYMNASQQRTNQRSVAFSKFWERMQLISAFSKVIFSADSAKRQTYLLYHEKVLKAQRKAKAAKKKGGELAVEAIVVSED